MSYEQLLIDFNIFYQTSGHKHCRPGWANMACPFCTGNPGLHLGMNLNNGAFYCWRCEWKPAPKAISALTGIDEKQAKELLRKYKSTPGSKKSEPKIKFKPHKLPSGTASMKQQHRKYLEDRGFDADYLEQEWRVLGTGPISKLDGIDYKHRILAPVYWGGKKVTFQTRDITNKANVKYMACPKERETIHHKYIVYGRQDKWTDTGICVEGITDVWRLGYNAFATFGIKTTKRQIRLIAKQFDRVIILFDDDPQAQQQAKQLQAELEVRGVETIIKTIQGDPADMPQDDADHLVKQLARR